MRWVVEAPRIFLRATYSGSLTQVLPTSVSGELDDHERPPLPRKDDRIGGVKQHRQDCVGRKLRREGMLCLEVGRPAA